MERRWRRCSILVWLMVLALLAGCGGEKKVKITGKLLKNGQPFTVSRDTYVTIAFIPEGETPNQKTHPAKFHRSTGAFEIELLAGKYRVNYIIVEKNKEPLPVPPEQKTKTYDLIENQELDIEIK